MSYSNIWNVEDHCGPSASRIATGWVGYKPCSAHDLIAIDHRRAGYIVTEHLLKLGCRRIAFVAYSKSASTVGFAKNAIPSATGSHSKVLGLWIDAIGPRRAGSAFPGLWACPSGSFRNES
jgi:hypothetical protein